ncbi:MAG: hypothetical protein WEE53_09060 [Acidimicrobiia bacterium]
MTMRRYAALVVLVLVLALASPASASVWDFGTTSCGLHLVGIRSYSTYSTYHFVLEPSYYETGSWNNGATWKVRTSLTNHYNNVEWGVEVVGGSLNDPGTYGYCTSYG